MAPIVLPQPQTEISIPEDIGTFFPASPHLFGLFTIEKPWEMQVKKEVRPLYFDNLEART